MRSNKLIAPHYYRSKNIKKKKVNLQSGFERAPPTQTPEPQFPRIRSLVNSSLLSLSAEASQGVDGEKKISTQPGLTNQTSEGSTGDSKTYREEILALSVSLLLFLNPRYHTIKSIDLGTPDDQKRAISTTGQSQFSQRRVPQPLSH